MEKEDWSTKEKYKDDSTKYPSYGRGMTPNINMNTFMVQECMTEVLKKPPVPPPASEDQPKEKKKDEEPNSQAQQRTRIIEPHRKKFEKEWVDWMQEKYVRNPISEVEDCSKYEKFLIRPDFDTKTKVESTNTKVVINKQLQDY